MPTNTHPITRRRTPLIALLGATIACSVGCATRSPDYDNQMTFRSPNDAVTTLLDAAQAGDTAQLQAIFGPAGTDVLSSGDPVADRHAREVFVLAANQTWAIDRKDSSTRELIVGHELWPFPIPIVKDQRGWWFNTAAGREEVLARRIGRNELAAIGALTAYVSAQNEYAALPHDGRPAGIYAQKIRSDAGRHNGLYWPQNNDAEPLSPLGEFAAAAAAEGYGGQTTDAASPYHGYYFRILTRQGDAAPDGAKDYVVNGDMTGGFAMIAFPAEYANSGIMTFIVGPDGIVREADLGEQTRSIATAAQEYNPDSTWQPVD